MTTDEATAIIAGYDGCDYDDDPEANRVGQMLATARRAARDLQSPQRAGVVLVRIYASLGATAPDGGDPSANGWAWYHGMHPIQRMIHAASEALSASLDGDGRPDDPDQAAAWDQG